MPTKMHRAKMGAVLDSFHVQYAYQIRFNIQILI